MVVKALAIKAAVRPRKTLEILLTSDEGAIQIVVELFLETVAMDISVVGSAEMKDGQQSLPLRDVGWGLGMMMWMADDELAQMMAPQKNTFTVLEVRTYRQYPVLY